MFEFAVILVIWSEPTEVVWVTVLIDVAQIIVHFVIYRCESDVVLMYRPFRWVFEVKALLVNIMVNHDIAIVGEGLFVFDLVNLC